jgi:hypothetical protein
MERRIPASRVLSGKTKNENENENESESHTYLHSLVRVDLHNGDDFDDFDDVEPLDIQGQGPGRVSLRLGQSESEI